MAKDGHKSQLKIIGLTGLIGAVVGPLLATSAEAGVEFKSYQTHSHVVFSVDPDVAYSVEPILNKDKIVGLRVILDNVREELRDLTSSADSRTEKVMVVKTMTPEGKRVVYQFLLSEKAKQAGIEFFDYRSKSPAEIAVDYWMKASSKMQSAKPAALPMKAAKVTKKSKSETEAATAPKAKKLTRKTLPRPSAPAFNGCGQPLIVATEGVADFKVYHRSYDYHGFFHLMPADSEYEYPTSAQVSDKQLTHYRLILKLYKEEQFALVLRTIEFFEAKFPKSPLEPELRFLKASTLARLGDRLLSVRYTEQADEMYRQVILDDPASKRARMAVSFLVQEIMAKGAPVLALEYSLMGAEQKPELFKDPMSPLVFRLATAESLYALGEYDRAERAYQALIDLGGRIAPEGAFRIGEIMSARKYWDRAVIYYEKALRDFPKDASRFPTVYFNLAEAYFRQGQYAEAERVFREFDRLFGSDDSASWAVHLRLAELEQIKLKAPDPKRHEIIADLYESVVNRHPYSPGALMAELRLSHCYKGLGPDDRARAFFENFFGTRDPKKLTNELVEPLPVEQWMDLAEAAFFVNNGEPRTALRRADEYRVRLPKIPLGDSFRKVYSQAVVELAQEISLRLGVRSALVDKTQTPNELLVMVAHYGDLVLKPEPLEYALNLARETLAIGDLEGAAKYIAAIELRLAEASDVEKDRFHLLRARQKRFLGEKPEAIMAELAEVRDDGPRAGMKLLELANQATERDDLRSAVAYDDRLFNTEAGRQLSVEDRMLSSIRQIDNLARLGDAGAAARAASTRMLYFGMETGFPNLLARIKELRAKALYDSGDYKTAVEAFGEILGASPDHPRHSEFEFMRGKALAKLGRENEALETFTKLAKAATPDDVWRKSAQEELDQLQWENKVSNQIKDRRSSQ